MFTKKIELALLLYKIAFLEFSKETILFLSTKPNKRSVVRTVVTCWVSYYVSVSNYFTDPATTRLHDGTLNHDYHKGIQNYA